MALLKAIVDHLLTNVSSAYIPDGYVSEQVLGPVFSKQQTGKLGAYGLDYLRVETNLKGGRGAYRRVEPVVIKTSTYSIVGHGLEGVVTKEDYRNYELPYKPEEDMTLGLTTQIWLEKEQTLAATLSNTAIMTQNTTLSGSAQLSDFANSDPISKFATARSTILNGCGVMPNTAIMDIYTWNIIRFHPQVLDALGFKWQRPGGLTPDELAVAMGVDRVLIAKPRYNSAKEGQADVLSAVWGKHIIFAVAPEKPAPYQVSLGYQVRYEGESPRRVFKSPINNPPESTSILVEDNYSMLISNASAGYLIANAVA